MKRRWTLLNAGASLLLLGACLPGNEPRLVPSERLNEVRQRVTPGLSKALAAHGLELGNPLFIRIFKESRELEIWLQPDNGQQYKLWKVLPIAAMSGGLGPKLKLGDKQAPEGFYSVERKSLNPQSRFHLSFNIGYPNAYDEANGCTGDFIMVHGNEVSIGCFAMTDSVIEDIYLIVEAALESGQASVPVHVFPFPLTDRRMAEAAHSPWLKFWKELQQGYTAFEDTRIPPSVKVSGTTYDIK